MNATESAGHRASSSSREDDETQPLRHCPGCVIDRARGVSALAEASPKPWSRAAGGTREDRGQFFKGDARPSHGAKPLAGSDYRKGTCSDTPGLQFKGRESSAARSQGGTRTGEANFQRSGRFTAVDRLVSRCTQLARNDSAR